MHSEVLREREAQISYRRQKEEALKNVDLKYQQLQEEVESPVAMATNFTATSKYYSLSFPSTPGETERHDGRPAECSGESKGQGRGLPIPDQTVSLEWIRVLDTSPLVAHWQAAKTDISLFLSFFLSFYCRIAHKLMAKEEECKAALEEQKQLEKETVSQSLCYAMPCLSCHTHFRRSTLQRRKLARSNREQQSWF